MGDNVARTNPALVNIQRVKYGKELLVFKGTPWDCVSISCGDKDITCCFYWSQTRSNEEGLQDLSLQIVPRRGNHQVNPNFCWPELETMDNCKLCSSVERSWQRRWRKHWVKPTKVNNKVKEVALLTAERMNPDIINFSFEWLIFSYDPPFQKRRHSYQCDGNDIQRLKQEPNRQPIVKTGCCHPISDLVKPL